MGTAMKHPVPNRVKPSFVIFDIRALWRSWLNAHGWASECPDVKNYKWRLNPVWHRMLYNYTHMTTVGVKWLISVFDASLECHAPIYNSMHVPCSRRCVGGMRWGWTGAWCGSCSRGRGRTVWTGCLWCGRTERTWAHSDELSGPSRHCTGRHQQNK